MAQKAESFQVPELEKILAGKKKKYIRIRRSNDFLFHGEDCPAEASTGGSCADLSEAHCVIQCGAFQSAAQRARFGLSFNQSHAKWKVACIAMAFNEYRQHGERIYTDALRILAEAWEGDIDSLRSEVLQGVVRFVTLYDHEYDPIRLIRQLKRTSSLTIYRSGQAMSGPNYQKYMHQILKACNGSSRSKSLPIKQ